MGTASNTWDTPQVPVLGLQSFWQEFLRHAPIWFIYISAIGLLHGALANYPDAGFDALGLERTSLAFTVAFPMVWFVLYFSLRIKRSTRIVAKWRGYLWLAVMAIGLPVLIVVGYQPYPLTYDQLSLLYETSQYVVVAVFIAHIVLFRGWQTLLMFFGVTFVYGLMLENTGIAMGYFFEPGFKLYLPPFPAPLVTMVGWCVVFYATVAITQHLARWWTWLAEGVWRRAIVTTAIALSIDAQLDPLASMSGVFWRWDGRLSHTFAGVPFINWAAWFGAFLPYSYFLYKILDREDWTPRRQNWELFLRVPLAALLGGCLCFAVMAIVEGGFDGPTFVILREFQGRLFPY